MGEFFNGWRRKAGLVTLGLACVLSAAWTRSYHLNEIAMLAVGDQQHEFSSMNAVILWRTWIPPGRPVDGFERIPIEALRRVANVKGIAWLKRFENSGAWSIPYWSLVLPLTLLSAWLILGKRPKAKNVP